jgi:hypothetical protein
VDLADNLIESKDTKYASFVTVDIKNKYKFTLTITETITTKMLYITIFSYIKNKNIIIKSINAVRPRMLGLEYINLINIMNLSLHEFLLLKNQLLIDEEVYNDSNILFQENISAEYPLQLEIVTFNINNITTNTKPKITEM